MQHQGAIGGAAHAALLCLAHGMLFCAQESVVLKNVECQ